jgi:hypothetical protein
MSDLAKQVIGLFLFGLATPAGILITTLSQRARDVAFFSSVFLLAVVEKVDVNFFGLWWYRGSSRGSELSLADVLAFSVLAGSVLVPRHRPRIFLPSSLGLMLLFFVYAAFSVLASDPQIYGVFELSKIARGILFFLTAAIYVRGERELTVLVAALCCDLCLEGLLCAKQQLQGVYRVTGTLDHANSLSMYLCLVAPVCVAAAGSTLPKWLRNLALIATVAASLSIVLTLSRAGIPIFAVVVLGTAALSFSWRFSFKQLAGAGLVFVCLAGMLFKFAGDIEERFGGSIVGEEYLDEKAFESRGFYLRIARAIVGDRFFGVGLNNWSYWVSKKYGKAVGAPYEDYDALSYEQHDKSESWDHLYAPPAHNLGALVVGELGIPGLFVFALLWLRWFQMGVSFLWSRTHSAMKLMAIGMFFGVCGVFLQSLTEWIFRQSNIFLTFHVIVGALAALRYQRKLARRHAKQAQAFASEPEFTGATLAQPEVVT